MKEKSTPQEAVIAQQQQKITQQQTMFAQLPTLIPDVQFHQQPMPFQEGTSNQDPSNDHEDPAVDLDS